ncbi:DUF420 domain-containing protein [Halomarina salina]|uniref:DUF420 domain-containing protein n=1 Tax=Halomarina salina TaxID=1872699 RepID=A0ABD5RQB5_9EURY|nr:DUF420 domain-containing protein [Halomarina salina]
MEFRAKDRVPLLTGVLTVVSLALVFAAVGQVIPNDAIPRSESLVELVPHLNAVISLAAIGTITAGWRWIRENEVARHRVAMLTSFVLFAAFLVLYLYRVSLEGPSEFPGPEAVYLYVYLPVLAVHILLAIVCVPLVYYALLLAATHTPSELRQTAHRRVGRVAASLWLVSFTLGVVVYALLYVVY